MGALALAGIAPLSGFFSKDEILTAAANPAVFVLLVHLWLLLTAFYMTRQVLMVFFGTRTHSHAATHALKAGAMVTIPLIILALLSCGRRAQPAWSTLHAGALAGAHTRGQFILLLAWFPLGDGAVWICCWPG